MSQNQKTVEEKIWICIKYLQKNGYQVIFPKHGKRSAEVDKLVSEQRDLMLKMGGASAATLLSAQDVSAMTGFPVSTINYHIEKHGFPRPVMGGQGSGSKTRHWRLSDVQSFVQAKASQHLTGG